MSRQTFLQMDRDRLPCLFVDRLSNFSFHRQHMRAVTTGHE